MPKQTKARKPSLADFQRDPAKLLKRPKKSGEPLVLSVDGKPGLIVQNVVAYQELIDRLDRFEAIEGIRRGLEQADRGEGIPIEEAFEELRLKHGITRRNHARSARRSR